MIPEQEYKLVAITPPAAIVDNAAFTTASVDCKGWDHCRVVVLLGATDIAMTVLKLQESDDDASADDYDDVPNCSMATGTNIDGSTAALPSATNDNKFFVWEVDCRGRKRYLDVAATGGDGTAGAFMTAIAILSRPKASPASIADRGCQQILRPNAAPA